MSDDHPMTDSFSSVVAHVKESQSVKEELKQGWENLTGEAQKEKEPEETIDTQEGPEPKIGDIRFLGDGIQEFWDGKKWQKKKPSGPDQLYENSVLNNRLFRVETELESVMNRMNELEEALVAIKTGDISGSMETMV